MTNVFELGHSKILVKIPFFIRIEHHLSFKQIYFKSMSTIQN
jgi:hypothetical protein